MVGSDSFGKKIIETLKQRVVNVETMVSSNASFLKGEVLPVYI